MAHAHDPVAFDKTRASDEMIALVRETHPALADNLALARRFGGLDEKDKEALAETQRQVEAFEGWTPGYHAPGDSCASCGAPTTVMFVDEFDEGELPYAAFILDVPVHARAECLEGFARLLPKPSSQALDKLRREHARDASRPSAGMTQFFRRDAFTQPPFALEDWANSVAEANENLDRRAIRDIERLVTWVHQRLYH